MRGLAIHLFAFFAQLGGLGLICLGAMDSSFLFLPLGNDLLMLGLTARHPNRLVFYACMAALGSMLGCAAVDWLSRKGGEEGLSKLVPERRLDYVRRKVKENAGWTLALAAVLPPPFPFTPFVAGAAAFQYPRRKLYGILAPLRLARFVAIGLLAMSFGSRILHWAESPVVHGIMLGFVAMCIGGSAWSLHQWWQRSKKIRA